MVYSQDQTDPDDTGVLARLTSHALADCSFLLTSRHGAEQSQSARSALGLPNGGQWAESSRPHLGLILLKSVRAYCKRDKDEMDVLSTV